MTNIEDEIAAWVGENPLTEKQELFKGPGYRVVIVPYDYFATQPVDFVSDAKPRENDTDRFCLNESDDSWACTRKFGHPGPHVAGYDTNRILQVW